MSFLRTLVIAALSVPAVTLAGALALIASQPPLPRPEGSAQGGDGQGLAFGGLTLPADPAPLALFPTRDGSTIGLRRYPSADPDAPLLILLHGSGWHGLQYDSLGRRLAEAGLATVLSPDLRGHGPQPQRRGDADRIDQVEDDIADLILAHRAPGQEVNLAA